MSTTSPPSPASKSWMIGTGTPRGPSEKVIRSVSAPSQTKRWVHGVGPRIEQILAAVEVDRAEDLADHCDVVVVTAAHVDRDAVRAVHLEAVVARAAVHGDGPAADRVDVPGEDQAGRSPAPPFRISPVPIVSLRMSLPSPPSSTSPPGPPLSWSSPPSPNNWSSPWPPVRMSSPSPPWTMMSSPKAGPTGCRRRRCR